MKPSTELARQLLVEAARAEGAPDPQWVERIERLSTLCAEGRSFTHIAFLGTSILAKAVDTSVDLFAIKPRLAPGNPKAYSARALCHTVLVPLSAELGINIGVTGREPLNNQPYFRMTKLGDETPVHASSRPAFDYMVKLVHELQAMESEHPAREALRAFVEVRRRYQPSYAITQDQVAITPRELLRAIEALVSDNSEGGKRAQAVVAGMFDVVFGFDRVESGRINDPSRRYPGDVCVRSRTNAWEKAIEVRDKPVQMADVYIFGRKCMEMGVLDAAIVMASPNQQTVEEDVLFEWAERFGLGLTLFHGWSSLIDQVLFWAPSPKYLAASEAIQTIESRLIEVEASPTAVVLWQTLIKAR